MVFVKQLTCILLFSAALVACNNSDTSPGKESAPDEAKSSEQSTELKVGGLYITKDSDSSYSACKILAMDDFAVHVRTYKEEFKTPPATLSSAALTIMIGHAPLDKKGFLQGQPKLLAVEDVKESELEGYKIYLEAMK